MKTHLYGGTKLLISQGDNSLMQSAIDSAIEEAKGYMSRFKIEQIFDNADNDPNWEADKVLLLHCKNIAKWNFVGIGNANIDYEDAQVRYERAIKWLQDIQAGKIVPVNWQPAEPENLATFFHISSNRKRGNHY
jgi:phage gp36-like protein